MHINSVTPLVLAEEPSFMKAPIRALLLLSALAALPGCGPRQVEVRTAPTTTTEQSVRVTNNLSQAVNVYVTTPSNGELFLRQIAANSVETVPVQGVPRGSNVTFKAVTVDGSRTYQSRNVGLTGLYAWAVP
jgi:hypothetical protein